jgi:hypothetical protein
MAPTADAEHYVALEAKRRRTQCHGCSRTLVDERGAPCDSEAGVRPLRCFAEPDGPAFLLCESCATAALDALDHTSYEQMIDDNFALQAQGHRVDDDPVVPSPWRCEPQPIRELTDTYKALGVQLAREHVTDAEAIASVHLGLGLVMLRELHWPTDKIVEMVRQIAEDHEPN